MNVLVTALECVLSWTIRCCRRLPPLQPADPNHRCVYWPFANCASLLCRLPVGQLLSSWSPRLVPSSDIKHRFTFAFLKCLPCSETANQIKANQLAVISRWQSLASFGPLIRHYYRQQRRQVALERNRDALNMARSFSSFHFLGAKMLRVNLKRREGKSLSAFTWWQSLHFLLLVSWFVLSLSMILLMSSKYLPCSSKDCQWCNSNCSSRPEAPLNGFKGFKSALFNYL